MTEKENNNGCLWAVVIFMSIISCINSWIFWKHGWRAWLTSGLAIASYVVTAIIILYVMYALLSDWINDKHKKKNG